MPLPDRLRSLLAGLVAFDTQNPSGDERAMVQSLATQLGALGAARVEAFAAGAHHGVFAVFGSAPSLLLNAHVDTVPANAGFTSRPHDLVLHAGRLHGLGAADTKGAIACILAALETCRSVGRSVRDVAILFSGDEESGGRVMREFLGSERADGLTHAIVCEPTDCRVGVRHRGIAAVRAIARSPGGHSSRADDLAAPVVTTARAAVALHAWGQRYRRQGPAGYEGLCVNVAAIDGGVAFNVVPTHAALTVSADYVRLRTEPIADIRVRYRPLHATTLDGDLVVRAIDEITILAVAAAHATGTTKIRDAGDLRGKESDRLATITETLRACGVIVVEYPDGLDITGGGAKAPGRTLLTHADHRIAMAIAVLAAPTGPHAIDDEGCIAVSFPDFTPLWRAAQISSG